MKLSLDEILNLSGLEDLKKYGDEIKRTIDALELKPGQRYLSVGTGKNKLPLVVALHGLNVVGLEGGDTAREAIEYQFDLITKFALYLREANGKLEVVEMDIDKTPLHQLPQGFDIIECVNFSHKYDEREVAQTLLCLGNHKANHLVSLFGGFGNENDKLASALEREARNLGREVKFVPKLFTSNAYPYNLGILLKIY